MQEPLEHVSIGPYVVGDFCNRARPPRERVGDPKLGDDAGDADALAELGHGLAHPRACPIAAATSSTSS